MMSGLPQGSVLGPALFLIYINDLPDCVTSNARLFADDTVIYRTIKSSSDSEALQADLDQLVEWEKRWDMELHPSKCQVMHVHKKRASLTHTYSMHGTELSCTDHVKYLGVTLSHDMKWTRHVNQVCSKGNRALGFIRRNVKIRSPRIKEQLYKTLVRPHTEYASTVWAPYETRLTKQIEMVQRRAARWTLNRHHNTSSVDRMLTDLQWRTLEQRRIDSRLLLVYKIVHGHVQIPQGSYLQPAPQTPVRRTHNHTFTHYSTRTNYLRFSYFPHIIPIWNNLPNHLVNCPSINSFKAHVSRLEHPRA